MNFNIIIIAILINACNRNFNDTEKMSIVELRIKPIVGNYQNNLYCIDNYIEKSESEDYNFEDKEEKIIHAIVLDDINTLKEFKANGFDFKIFSDLYSNSFLDYALYLGSPKCSKYLLNEINILNRKQIRPSPLHFLILGKMDKENKKILTKKILEKNPKAFEEKTFDDHNSLMFATIVNDFEAFKKIYDKMPLLLNQYTDSDLRMSVPGYAAIFESKEIFDFLYKQKNDSNKTLISINDQDEEGRTALMLACANNRREIFNWLISNENIDLLAKDKKGKTAIYYASYYKNPEMTLDLIRKIYSIELDRKNFNAANKEVGSAANRFLLNDEVHDKINLLKEEAIKNRKDSL